MTDADSFDVDIMYYFFAIEDLSRDYNLFLRRSRNYVLIFSLNARLLLTLEFLEPIMCSYDFIFNSYVGLLIFQNTLYQWLYFDVDSRSCFLLNSNMYTCVFLLNYLLAGLRSKYDFANLRISACRPFFRLITFMYFAPFYLFVLKP